MDNTSQNPGGQGTHQASTTSSINSNPPSNIVNANETFRAIVQEMLLVDKRFKGMSKYVTSIEFFWSSAIETACAGYGFIFFNKEFWDKLDPEQQKTVVAHEIFHLMLNHLDRGEGKDPQSYNIAGDHVINNALKEDGFPIDQDSDFGGVTPCCDPQYAGMGTDAVYAKVHEERKKDPSSQKAVPGTPSRDQIKDLIEEALQGTGDTIEEQAAKDEKLRENVADKSKQIGNEAGNVERTIWSENKRVLIQKAPYEKIFESYLTDPLSGGKRTLLRPSRRQMSGGLRIKGRNRKIGKKERLKHLVYALDVSGSIQSWEANLFLASAKTLKQMLNPTAMTVMLWDTSIKFEKTFYESDTLDNIKVYAGGGTSLTPVYSRCQQLNPEAVVIFTDLAVAIPPKPSWETIWFVSSENIHDTYLQAVNYGDVYLVPREK